MFQTLSALSLVLGSADDAPAVFGVLGGIAVIIYIVHSIKHVSETKAREATKREIAAYVAEGSISPADAERIIAAGNNDAAKTIADGVASGNIKPEKAEALFRTLNAPKAT